MRHLRVGRLIIVLILLAVAACLSSIAGCSCACEPPKHKPSSVSSRYTPLPNEEQFDVPIYKEAIVGNSVKGTVDKADGTVTRANLNYQTKDHYDDVTEWYRDRLGAPTSSSDASGAQTSVWHEASEGYDTTITLTPSVSGDDTGTFIDITKAKV